MKHTYTITLTTNFELPNEDLKLILSAASWHASRNLNAESMVNLTCAKTEEE